MCDLDNKNERLDWLDILKCLVIYLVILVHVLDSEVRSLPDSYAVIFCNIRKRFLFTEFT